MKLSSNITNYCMVARKRNDFPMTIPCDEKEFILVSRREKNDKRIMTMTNARPNEFKMNSQKYGQNMGLYNVKVKKDARGLSMNVQVNNKRSMNKSNAKAVMKNVKKRGTNVNNMSIEAVISTIENELRTFESEGMKQKRIEPGKKENLKSNFKFDEQRFNKGMQELTKHMQKPQCDSTRLTEINRFIILIRNYLNDLQIKVNNRDQKNNSWTQDRKRFKEIKRANYKKIIDKKKYERKAQRQTFKSKYPYGHQTYVLKQSKGYHRPSEYAFSTTTASSVLPPQADKELNQNEGEINEEEVIALRNNEERSWLSDKIPTNHSAEHEIDHLNEMLLTIKEKPEQDLNEGEIKFKQYVESIEKENSEDLNDGDYEMKQHIKDVTDSVNNYKMTSSDDTATEDHGNIMIDQEAHNFGFKFRQNRIQKEIISLDECTSNCNKDIVDEKSFQKLNILSQRIIKLANDGIERYKEDYEQYYFTDVLEYVAEAVYLAEKGQNAAKRRHELIEQEKQLSHYKIDRKHHIKLNTKFKELEKEVQQLYEKETKTHSSTTSVYIDKEVTNDKDKPPPAQISTKDSRRKTTEAGGNGGDDDSSDSSKSSKKKHHNDNNKKKRFSKRKGRRDSSSSIDSDTSALSEKSINDVDKKYRSILKGLLKTAKNFCIKELSLSSDPKHKRERFLNWVVDIKSVLSCDYRTAGLMDSYPSSLEPFQDDIDKAIRGLLISTTRGAARDLITRAATGFDGLIDLKRNCAQCTIVDENES